MEALFGALSLVGCVVAIFILIFALIKKNKKLRNRTYIGFMICLVVFIVCVSNTDSSKNNDVATDKKVESTEKKKTTESAAKPTESIKPIESNTSPAENPVTEIQKEPVTTTTSETEYRNKMTNHSQKLSKAFQTFSEVFINPKIRNDNWTKKAAASVVEIQSLAENPPSGEVPPAFKEVHSMYLQSMDKYIESMNMLSKALDSRDINQLNAAQVPFEEGTEFIDKAVKLMNN
ncbi:hypothetical protein [Bacillus sp. XF8]|uniref:DUF7018 domain-containing (lipo)protein n=1 Tax=Bacillus sp. XF8 TaxID=2819289 RepID=UPI001AA090F8|nr:hypothetical protein [Bacillus sp. XF8]MBO1583245.1 hypothetical protein [Bacillus sp. XF8]